MTENRTNILFPTTRCNLYCDYCYQEPSRENFPEQIDIDESEIISYLHEITERESGNVSTVVIMGGEVFMKPHLLEIIIRNMRNFGYHKWAACITTNGTLFGDFIFINHLYRIKGNNTHISFEISYDHSGHHRRKFRSSGRSSKKVVQQSIEGLIKHGYPFKISYTLHKDNYWNVIHDLIWMFEKWGHCPNFSAVKLSLFRQELFENFGTDAITRLEPYVRGIIKQYGKGVCLDSLVCDVCGICDISNFVGNSYNSPASGKIHYEPAKTEKGFDKWRKE